MMHVFVYYDYFHIDYNLSFDCVNISFGSTSRVVSDADRDNIVTVKRLLMIYESYWSLLFDDSIGDVIVTIA